MKATLKFVKAFGVLSETSSCGGILLPAISLRDTGDSVAFERWKVILAYSRKFPKSDLRIKMPKL